MGGTNLRILVRIRSVTRRWVVGVATPALFVGDLMFTLILTALCPHFQGHVHLLHSKLSKLFRQCLDNVIWYSYIDVVRLVFLSAISLRESSQQTLSYDMISKSNNTLPKRRRTFTLVYYSERSEYKAWHQT